MQHAPDIDLRLLDKYVDAIQAIQTAKATTSAALSRLQVAHNQFIGESSTGGPAYLLETALGDEKFAAQRRTFISSLYLYHITSSLFLFRILRHGLTVGKMPLRIAGAIETASLIYRRIGLSGDGRFDLVDDLDERPIYCRAAAGLVESTGEALRHSAADGLPAFAFELLDEQKTCQFDWPLEISDDDMRVLTRCWRVGRIVRRFSRMIALRIRIGSELLVREGIPDVVSSHADYRKYIFSPHVTDLLIEGMTRDAPVAHVLCPDPEKALPDAFRTVKAFGLDIPLNKPVPVNEIEILARSAETGEKNWIPLIEFGQGWTVVTLAD